MKHYSDYSILIFDFRGKSVTESDGDTKTEMTVSDMRRYMNEEVYDPDECEYYNFLETRIGNKQLSYSECKALFQEFLECVAQDWFEEADIITKIIE